jgi:hypothetical protein
MARMNHSKLNMKDKVRSSGSVAHSKKKIKTKRASLKQLALLTSLGIKNTPDMNMSTASRLIDQKLSKKILCKAGYKTAIKMINEDDGKELIF